jgi:hypothetical protein
VPDPTLERASVPAPEGPAVNGREGPPRTMLLSLRLRTQDSRGAQADVSWAGGSSAAALAIDVISASGGASDPPKGALLAAGFFNLPSALLAARRLQWALQGLGESAGSHNAAASIAIHSMEDPAGSAVVSLLDHVAPGQVLVSSRIADAIQQLPGATLRPTVDGSWRELQWRGFETPSGYSTDEQSVLGMIRALGREDPCPPQAEAPRTLAVSQAAPATEVVPERLGRPLLEPEPQSAFAKWKWLIIGGAAAAVVLVVVLVAIVSGGHGKTPAQNPDAATKATSPDTTTPLPAAPPPSSPVAEKPQPPKPPAKPGRQPKTDSKVEQPAQKTGPCNLTEAEIPRSLTRAENYMYAGKLDEAEAVYQRVLGCPTAHEKALEGLQRVHQRMAAQSP